MTALDHYRHATPVARRRRRSSARTLTKKQVRQQIADEFFLRYCRANYRDQLYALTEGDLKRAERALAYWRYIHADAEIDPRVQLNVLLMQKSMLETLRASETYAASSDVAASHISIRDRIRTRLRFDPQVILRWGALLFTSLVIVAAIGFAFSRDLLGFFSISAALVCWGLVGLADTVVRGEGVQDPRLSTLIALGGIGAAVTTIVAWLT